MLELSEKQQFRKSWNSTIPEFENLLTKIRNGKLKDALELITVSSGKYVYYGKAEGLILHTKLSSEKNFCVIFSVRRCRIGKQKIMLFMRNSKYRSHGS